MFNNVNLSPRMPANSCRLSGIIVDGSRKVSRKSPPVFCIYLSGFSLSSMPCLRVRIREIAETRIRYEYLRIHTLLRCEGWHVNK